MARSADRPGERTLELYAWLLRRHILPTFGVVLLTEIRTPDFRRWYVDLARSRPTTAAKAYLLPCFPI